MTHIYGRNQDNGRDVVHRIYWDKVSSVRSDSATNRIFLSGSNDAFSCTAASWAGEYIVEMPNRSITWRVRSAMGVIREACDRGARLGF